MQQFSFIVYSFYKFYILKSFIGAFFIIFPPLFQIYEIKRFAIR